MTALHSEVRFRRENWGVLLFRRDRILEGEVHAVHPFLAYLIAAWNNGALDQAASDQGMSLADAEAVVQAFVKAHPLLFSERNNSSLSVRPEDYLYEPCPRPDSIRLSWPIAVSVMITDECSRACKYCCITTRPPGHGTRLSYSLFRLIVKECSSNGTGAVILHGGEPLIHPDILSYIESAAKSGMQVLVSTKETLDIQQSRALLDSGLTAIQVSLDSPNAGIQRELTGLDIEAILDTIDNLTRVGLRVTVNAVANKYTARDLEQLFRLCSCHGVIRLTISPYFPALHKDQLHELTLSSSDYAEIEEAAAAAASGNPSPVQITVGSPGIIDFLGPCENCSALRTVTTINPRGEVVVCDRLANDARAVVGNLNKETLSAVWSSQLARSIAQPDPVQYAGTECEGCSALRSCIERGLCIYRTLFLHSKIHGPPLTPSACITLREGRK